MIGGLVHDPRRPCTRTTRQCDFKNWGAAYERPDCCTEHLLELLELVHELLSEEGIPHWLDYGTLLGAVRDGRLIPWDDDADVSAFRRDYERVLALSPRFEAAGHRIWLGNPDSIRVVYSEANGNHVDIWFWREEDELLVSDEDAIWQWPGMQDRQGFPLSFVEPLGEVVLQGRTFPAPQPVDEFLRDHRYGLDYLTPIRPITTLANRHVIPSAEMTPTASEVLARIADRDSHLVGLVNSRSRLLGSGRWTVGHTRWLNLSGLPLEASLRELTAAQASVDPSERTPAVDSLLETLAWIEEGIAEYEQPPRLIGLRRAYRRYRRIRDALLGRIRS